MVTLPLKHCASKKKGWRDLMSAVLLLIDIQNDYFPGGRMELAGPIEAAEKASMLLNFFRKNRMPRLHVQHISLQQNAPFFLPDTPGVNIHESVAPAQRELIVQKHFPSSFRETNLLELLCDREAERIVICGMMTHMCIDATVRAAADLGFKVMVVADACATRTLQHENLIIPAEHVQGAFLAALKTYGQILCAEEMLSMLDAGL
jgi:nicotinamidase-related amidase